MWCGIFFDGSLITTSGLSITIYKSLFMPKDTIGVILKSGYVNNVNQSVVGTMW